MLTLAGYTMNPQHTSLTCTHCMPASPLPSHTPAPRNACTQRMLLLGACLLACPECMAAGTHTLSARLLSPLSLYACLTCSVCRLSLSRCVCFTYSSSLILSTMMGVALGGLYTCLEVVVVVEGAVYKAGSSGQWQPQQQHTCIRDVSS